MASMTVLYQWRSAQSPRTCSIETRRSTQAVSAWVVFRRERRAAGPMAGRPVSVKVDQDAASALYASRMASRIASCAVASPFAGRSSAKLRRSPIHGVCRAGNVTLRPPARRSQTEKPMSLSPGQRAGVGFEDHFRVGELPWGIAGHLGMIRTDITCSFCLDMGPPVSSPWICDRRRWLSSRGSYGCRRTRVGRMGSTSACAVTEKSVDVLL